MRRFAAVVALIVLAALASACSDDGSPEADPSPSGSSAEAPPTTGEPTSEPPTSAPPSATVQPATGPSLDLKYLSVRAPEGWDAYFSTASQARADDLPETTNGLAVSGFEAILGSEGLDLRTQAQIAIDSGAYLRRPTIREPVEIAGVSFYRVAGRINKVSHLESFGTTHDGVYVTLDFQLNIDQSAAERQKLIDSVLASFKFK